MQKAISYRLQKIHACTCDQSYPTLASLWTIARQAPLSMGILQVRILKWLSCPPPGDLPKPGIEPRSPALQVNSLPSEPPGKPKAIIMPTENWDLPSVSTRIKPLQQLTFSTP